MARVTHVKKAQQRYATVPVLDENGNPVKIALTNKDGSPKMTRAKGGRAARPVFITKTVADKTKPLPPLRCDFHGCDIDEGKILPGSAYKWIAPKSGPYGGRRLNRHAEHPTWQVWEYSNSLSARIAQIQANAKFPDGAESVEDVQSALEAVAEEIRSLAEEKNEAADSLEEGFGHETYQSQEIREVAEQLESWADEVEQADIPDPEDSEYRDEDEIDCSECNGSGMIDADEDDPEADDNGQVECTECGGTGQVENEDPETDWDAWREAVQEAFDSAINDNCPL